jgi:hypothetical protein
VDTHLLYVLSLSMALLSFIHNIDHTMYLGCIWDVSGMYLGCIWDVFGMYTLACGCDSLYTQAFFGILTMIFAFTFIAICSRVLYLLHKSKDASLPRPDKPMLISPLKVMFTDRICRAHSAAFDFLVLRNHLPNDRPDFPINNGNPGQKFERKR